MIAHLYLFASRKFNAQHEHLSEIGHNRPDCRKPGKQKKIFPKTINSRLLLINNVQGRPPIEIRIVEVVV